MINPRCNLCGNNLDFWDIQEGWAIHRQIGYGSNYDGEMLDLHLCCNCTDKIIEACSISPIVRLSEAVSISHNTEVNNDIANE